MRQKKFYTIASKRSLKFLNLSNNLLSDPVKLSKAEMSIFSPLPLRKLVLNGNKLDWKSVNLLASMMPHLEELHLSNNALTNPTGDFRHASVRRIFLTCNAIDSFEDVYEHLGKHCPALEMLSLAECPLTSVPIVKPDDLVNKKLYHIYNVRSK